MACPCTPICLIPPALTRCPGQETDLLQSPSKRAEGRAQQESRNPATSERDSPCRGQCWPFCKGCVRWRIRNPGCAQPQACDLAFPLHVACKCR